MSPHTPHRRKPLGLMVTLMALGLIALFRLLGLDEEAPGTASKRRVGNDRDLAVVSSAGNDETGAGAKATIKAGSVPEVYQLGAALPSNAPSPLAPRYDVPSKAEAARRFAPLTGLDAARLAGLRAGDRIRLALFDGAAVTGVVNLAEREASGLVMVGGALPGKAEGSFSLKAGPAGVSGVILPADGDTAYLIQGGTDGRVYLVEKPREAVLCLPMATLPANVAATTGGGVAMAIAAPVLSSRPTAGTVIYLDFDGETVTDPDWNNGRTIVASVSGLTSAQMTAVWQMVREDFLPFNVDVTTDLSHYTRTPAGRRMRCIITRTSTWYGDAGGVGYVGSWADAGQFFSSTVPCWVFANRLGGTARFIADAVSHEVGHTLGLSHDGLETRGGVPVDEYFEGHGFGATSWAPIMGSADLNINLIQWSKGDYGDSSGLVANNQEDDLAIITSVGNHVAYVVDEAGDSNATAVVMTGNGTATLSATGLIARTGDADRFAFATGGGTVSFTLDTQPGGVPNLDAALRLINAQDVPVAQSDPAASLYPQITASLAAGIYYLRITGVGEGDPFQTGYTNYGSIGSYAVRGTVVPPPAPTPGSVSATDTLADRVIVTWSAATDATGYDVYRATSNSTSVAVKLNGTPLTATTFTDTTGTVGTQYFYWVRSKGLAGDSDFSVPDGGMKVLVNARQLGFAGSLAFGSMPVGTIKTATLTVSNTGNALLTVTRITFPSGPFKADVMAFTLAPGASQKVVVTFAPNAAGSFGGVISFVSNANVGATTLPISALATANNKATLTFAGLAMTYTGTARAVTVLTSPANVGYKVTYNGLATAPTDAGSYDVVATALAPYTGIKTGTLVISKAAQTITFGALPKVRAGTPVFTLTGSASSGLSVAYASSNRAVATVSGDTLTVVGKGTTTITAKQAGNGNYRAAADVPQVLTVEPAAVAPVFTRQPLAKNVIAGQTVTLSVTATGLPAPVLRWQVSLDGGGTFSDVDDDAVHAGATTVTLSIKTVATLDGFRYRCSATNVAGVAFSEPALLTVTVPRPSNDNFSGRIPLIGTVATVAGSSTFATKEPGEPKHAGGTGGRSVWWTWTAPASGIVTLSTAGSSFDTLLGVYTGTNVGTLVPVDDNDDSSAATFSSQVRFGATAGSTYQFAVDGFLGASGSVRLALALIPGNPGPVNDNLAQSIILNGRTVTTTGSNVAGTSEVGEPDHAGERGGRSVWWQWTAPDNGILTVSTAGSSFDTLLGLYTGLTVDQLNEVASNDDNGSAVTSRISIPVIPGTTYWIAVDGFHKADGTISLSLSLGGPANDNFSDRIRLTGTALNTTGANAGATSETGEPNHANVSGGRSVWWTWTAPSGGTVTLSTAGSSFDTTLAVYTGGTVGHLTAVASNDDDPGQLFALTSRVVFPVTAGTTYQIAVDGLRSQGGGTSFGNISLGLQLVPPPPANDNFAGRIRLSGSTVSTTGTNASATFEANEPDHVFNAEGPFEGGGRSVWWTWTASISGPFTVSTIGSNFDTVLAVYAGSSLGSLSFVAANDDISFGLRTSQVTINATAGTTYQIAVDGFRGATGSIVLNIARSTAGSLPTAGAAGTSATLSAGPKLSAGKELDGGTGGSRGSAAGDRSYQLGKHLSEFTVSADGTVAWVSALNLGLSVPPPTPASLPPVLAAVMNLDDSSPSALLPVTTVVNADGAAYLTLQFRQDRVLAALGLGLVVQSSADGTEWSELPASAITALADDDIATARYAAAVSIPDDGKLLLRVILAVDPMWSGLLLAPDSDPGP